LNLPKILGIKNHEPHSFFWETVDKKANIGTVSELGRLLLSGWYYGEDVEDFTLEIAIYIFRAYQSKKESGEAFNDLEFKEAVKKIREDIGYYYHNQNELKLYILSTFFKDKLQPLLPDKPKELKTLDDTIQVLEDIKANNLKKDKQFYFKRAMLLEDYVAYLEEVLEVSGINGYLSEREFKEEQNVKDRAYWDKIKELEKNYKELIKSNTLKHSEKLLPTK
jgi:hypothetical protein